MFHKTAVEAAKLAINLWPAEPREEDLSLGEIFGTRRYKEAGQHEKLAMQLKSSQYRYDYEADNCLFAEYFPDFDTAYLQGKDLLDLGCFTGGRLIYWKEAFGIARACGIDISQTFADAGSAFAASRGVSAEFFVGFGEALPLPDESVDVIVSYDVLEHVRSVSEVLKECLRVLRPNGRLFAVFPPFFQPFEAHLGHVTHMPGLHILFPRDILAEAYFSIIGARGEQASWYRRSENRLADWERLMTLNGITVSAFRKMIQQDPNWSLISWSNEPILRQGRRAKELKFRLMSALFSIGARLPILEEVCLGRICCILEKRP